MRMLLALCGLAGTLAGCGSSHETIDGHAAQASAMALPVTVTSKTGLYTVTLEWLSGLPPVGSVGSARLTFLGANGQAPAKVVVQQAVLLMPAHTHVLEVSTSQVDNGPGNEVSAAGIHVTMSGAWELRLTANIDGVSDAAVLPFVVPAA